MPREEVVGDICTSKLCLGIAYQAGHVWAASITRCPEEQDPTEWGWNILDRMIQPNWSDLEEASKACR